MKTLLFCLSSEELDGPIGRAAREVDSNLRTCVATGTAESADVALGLGEDLASEHHLVARLEELLIQEAAERVILPCAEQGSLASRALGATLLAALSLRPPCLVRRARSDGSLETADTNSHDAYRQRRRDREGATATAVISTWNKSSDVRENLASLRGQTRPFDAVIVVDNASSDDTASMIAEEFPEVRLIVMPNSAYGACETFNVGFASSSTQLTAILDDDIVMSPGWLERSQSRLAEEPDTTAILSTKIVEPEMPESYRTSEKVNTERYMSTFRGCASLARSAAIKEAGFYDERLFIYGNERDLTCRLLARGYRVLQYPTAEVFHKTPFGIKMGKRSLYYHARNAWITMFKYAPFEDLVKMPFLVISKVLLRSNTKEVQGEVSDATGTIGIGRSLRETPGAWLVLLRAGFSVLRNIPYCLRHREPVRADDFELPLQ